MKNISINKKKILPYSVVMVILYLLLGIAYGTRELDNFPKTSITSVMVMPLAILFLGIMDIKASERIKTVLTILLLIYIPTHIVSFVLGDYSIDLLLRFFVNSLAVFALLMLLMAICLNIGIAAFICCLFAFLILTLNIYVVAFRGTAVTPGDILAASTAFKVSGGYSYFINLSMVSSIMYSIIILQLISKLCISFKGIKPIKSVGLRCGCFVLSMASAITVVSLAQTATAFETRAYNAFDTNMTNQKIGTILNFIVNVQRSKLEPPEEYSNTEAEKILESVTKAEVGNADVKKPNIIVIMNEAFCDIDKIYEVNPDEDPLEFWHSLTDNTISGDMMVSIDGGGTSYTEFEFLTGLSGGIIPLHNTPYLDYIKQNTHSLAWDLKKDGYTNIAIHPFWGSCWNRDVVYPLLGFDSFIAGEDFSSEKTVNAITSKHVTTRTNLGDDLEYVRDYVSDRESYSRVINSFENKTDDEKLFVFNVTVQNHSGFKYDGDNFTADVTSPADTSGELNQYLSVLKQSDIAYKELVEYFKDYDEPTVILMFGDHQPAIDSDEYRENVREEYSKYAQNGINLENYIVPYKLWANYNIDDEQCDITSASYLSLMLKKVAGIDYDSWDDFRFGMQSVFDVVTSRGYMSEGGTKMYAGNDDEKNVIVEQYKELQYYLLKEQGLMGE